jgi:hypothetical protein
MDTLTPRQQSMIALFERHVEAELAGRSRHHYEHDDG